MGLILEYMGMRPQIADDVYIAPNATIIGNVRIERGANVWFGAVLRGDIGFIGIGPGTSVQDNVVVHVNDRHDTIVGADVIIGHGVVIEGCKIGDGALLGMNATVLSGAEIGAGALVAAGAVVREGAEIPPHMLAAGVPANVKGRLDETMKRRLVAGAAHYQVAAMNHKENRRL